MILPILREEILWKLGQFEHHRFVEATNPDSYEKSHLPRAVLLPHDSTAKRGPQLLPDHGEQVIVYDEGGGRDAWDTARMLEAQGHHNLFVYAGGKRDWIEHGEMAESQIEPNPSMYNPSYPLSIFP